MSRFLPAFALALAACGTAAPSPPREPPFSFAIIADPHITSNAAREERLSAVVSWINGQAAARGVELVLVLGDIGWGAGVEKAASLLDALAVPWAPLIGDNEIHDGSEEAFTTVFGPRIDRLAATQQSLRRAPAPVANPETGESSWFVNYSFVHRGVRFVCLDWSARSTPDDLSGERGFAHDLPGGTWPWFVADLELSSAAADGIVLASHIPMHGVALDAALLDKVRATLAPIASRVRMNVAGHIHFAYEMRVDDLYDVFVSSPPWADAPVVRIFTVQPTDGGFEYTPETVPVPL